MQLLQLRRITLYSILIAEPITKGSPPFGLTPIGLTPIGLPPIGLSPFGLPPFGLPQFGLPPIGLTPNCTQWGWSKKRGWTNF